MGKRKKDVFQLQLKEAVDPRFSNLFKPKDEENEIEQPEEVSKDVHSGDSGFQTFVRCRLAEYLNKSLKEVDRPAIQSEIFVNRIDGIRLFSDSELINQLDVEEPSPQKSKKKKHKRKKSFDDEAIKEVAVTTDWLKRQAQILNS